MLWAMYRGAFLKYISPTFVYLMILGTFISVSIDFYGDVKYFWSEATTEKELLFISMFYILLLSLASKIILAAKKQAIIQ